MSESEKITTIEQLKQYQGEEIRVSDWHQVTQAEVDTFANLTGERGWIHVDQERAAKSRFGGTIAQGNLLLSMAPALLEAGTGKEVMLNATYGLNYGLNRVRYPAPVPVGARIRARLKLLEVQDVAADVYQLVWQRTIEIEGSAKPAMVAESLSRQFFT
jgi:acyl dehydratase